MLTHHGNRLSRHLEKGDSRSTRSTSVHPVEWFALAGVDKSPTLTYVMFGGDKQFLAHFISKPPTSSAVGRVGDGDLPNPTNSSA